MTYVQFLLSTPFFWVAVAGIWTGITVSRISRSPRRLALARVTRTLSRAATVTSRDTDAEIVARETERIRSRGWTLFYLGMSAAMIFVILGIFIPGSARILDHRLLYDFGIFAALFFAAFRFKRAAGFPLLIVASLLVIGGYAALAPFTIVRDPVTVLAFRELSTEAGGMDLEIVVPPNLPHNIAFFHVGSPDVVAVIQTVQFSDLLFLAGGTAAYRVEGVAPAPTAGAVSGRTESTAPVGAASGNAASGGSVGTDSAGAGSADTAGRAGALSIDPNSIHEIASVPGGVIGGLYRFFALHADEIPGIHRTVTRSVVLSPVLLQPYLFLVGTDGSVAVVPRSTA